MPTKSSDQSFKLGRADEPGAPGPVPIPDHYTDIPAAPATHPPEPPVVPSDLAIADLWSTLRPIALILAAVLLIGLLVLFGS